MTHVIFYLVIFTPSASGDWDRFRLYLVSEFDSGQVWRKKRLLTLSSDLSLESELFLCPYLAKAV